MAVWSSLLQNLVTRSRPANLCSSLSPLSSFKQSSNEDCSWGCGWDDDDAPLQLLEACFSWKGLNKMCQPNRDGFAKLRIKIKDIMEDFSNHWSGWRRSCRVWKEDNYRNFGEVEFLSSYRECFRARTVLWLWRCFLNFQNDWRGENKETY